MQTSDLYEEYAEYVNKAATNVARGAYHLSVDDLQQMLWEWLLSTGHKYIKSKKGDMNIGAILHGAAERLSMKELNDWRTSQGNFTYQPKEVRRMLTDYGDDTSKDVEARLDLQQAMTKLKATNNSYYHAIKEQYCEGVKHDARGRQRVSRGIDTLTVILNNGSQKARERVSLDDLTNQPEPE